MHKVLDGLFAFVGLLSPDGVLLEANRAALDAIAAKPEDVLGKFFWETPWWTHSPEDQERLKQAIRQCVQGQSSRFEVRHHVSESRTLIMDFSLSPMFDDDGRVEYLIPSSVDVTERVMAERQREEMHQTLRLCRQALDRIPKTGDWHCGDLRVVPVSAQGLNIPVYVPAAAADFQAPARQVFRVENRGLRLQQIQAGELKFVERAAGGLKGIGSRLAPLASPA